MLFVKHHNTLQYKAFHNGFYAYHTNYWSLQPHKNIQIKLCKKRKSLSCPGVTTGNSAPALTVRANHMLSYP